jgi:hypothetical protein
MKAKPYLTPLRALAAILIALVLWNPEFALVAKADSRNCTPNVDQVALFIDDNFQGLCVVLDVAEYSRIVRPPKASDSAGPSVPRFSSAKLGANAEMLACEAPNFGGTCVLLYQGAKTFTDRGIRTATSFIVRREDEARRCQPNPEQIAYWYHQYFFGQCFVVDSGYVNKYHIDIRSLVVGSSAEALLCLGFDFEGQCVVTSGGYYSRWSFPGRPADEGAVEVALAVRPKGQVANCEPGDAEVALFEYGHFVGQCKVFGVGEYSPQETVGWVNSRVRSIKVGANAHFRAWWQASDGDRFHDFGRRDVPRGLSMFSIEHHPSLKVESTFQTSSGGSSSDGASSDTSDGHTSTVWLIANGPYTGYPWWQGRYPAIGSSDGTLTRVANPRNSVWLGFLRPGYGSEDCGNPDAYVLLRPGESMSPDQMRAVFGSQQPLLPVQFLACSDAVAQTDAAGNLRFPTLPLNITWQ